MPNAILDPTGTTKTAGPPQGAPRARRRTYLHGATVGLLVNTKQNAAPFLDEVGRLLAERYGTTVAMARTKVNFAQPAPEDLVKEMAASCDVIITGIGDCGSCSASAVADGVTFEAAGLPAAQISHGVGGDAERVAADDGGGQPGGLERDAVRDGGRAARAAVADPGDDDLAARGHLYMSRHRRIAQRIDQQVGQDLHGSVSVGHHQGKTLWHLDVQLEALLSELPCQRLKGAVYKMLWGNRLQREWNLTRLGPRQFLQIVN